MHLLIPFLAAFAATVLLTPVVRLVARRLGFVAYPAQDRWHRQPTALMGGIGIYAGFLAGLAAAAVAGSTPAGDLALEANGRAGVGIMLAATLMFFTGLGDDRWKFRPATKLVLQILAATVLVSFGVVYPLTPWEPVNVLLTLFWFLAITNALNLLDNMDGVAIGIAGIAALFLAITFAWNGQWLLATACAALVGAAAGFLPYNHNPASIFMGDSGSLFIGSVLAGLGAMFPAVAPGSIVSVFFVPALIVILPIADTLLVTVTRTVAGRPISSGGRDHTSHRLVALGLSEVQTALVLYAFAAAGGILALLLQWWSPGLALWIGALGLTGFSILAAYLGRLHAYSRDEVRASRRFTILVSDLLYKRRALEVVLDVTIFGMAYIGAFLLRFDVPLPQTQAELLTGSLALAIGAKLAIFALLGVYRGTWQHLAATDLHRLGKAVVLGTLATLACVVFFFREDEFSRSVFLIDALLVAVMVAGARLSFRSLDVWSMRLRTDTGGARTLVYGAGQYAGPVLFELRANRSHGLQPIGFLDDRGTMHGRMVHDLPVLGDGAALPRIAAARAVQTLLIGPDADVAGRLDEIGVCCRELGIDLLVYRVELERVDTVAERKVRLHAPV